MITTIKELQKSNIQLPAWLNLNGSRYHVTDMKFGKETVLIIFDKTFEGEEQESLDCIDQDIDDTRISISENINEEEEKELHSLAKKEINDLKKMIDELSEKIETLSPDMYFEVKKYFRSNILSPIESERSFDLIRGAKRAVRIIHSSRIRLRTENDDIMCINLSHISQYVHDAERISITMSNGEVVNLPENQENLINIYVLDALFMRFD